MPHPLLLLCEEQQHLHSSRKCLLKPLHKRLPQNKQLPLLKSSPRAQARSILTHKTQAQHAPGSTLHAGRSHSTLHSLMKIRDLKKAEKKAQKDASKAANAAKNQNSQPKEEEVCQHYCHATCCVKYLFVNSSTTH